jgi:cytochrome c peroxidase
MRKSLVLMALLFIWYSFSTVGSELFKVPQGWPVPVYDFNSNRLSVAKVFLGRVLFYDPVLSSDSSISCASCHSQYTAFAHVDHDLSHGIRDQIGNRNAPTLQNLAWSKSFMWDGAIHHLDMQALAPIANAKEMDEKFDHVIEKINTSALYKKLFYNAFEDSTITGEHFLKAISQFMLTLVSANSNYDKMLRGTYTFTDQEQNGYAIFKSKCASCHTEPLFTDGKFTNNGLKIDSTLNDLGKYTISGKERDMYVFKTPTLRNIEFSYPYMHDGRFKRLYDVLNHYTSGIVPYPNLDSRLKNGIALLPNEKTDIIAFLLTLSDREFLFNKNFSFPREVLELQE